MNAIKEKLDVTERGKFRRLEAIVAEGISSFVVVGEALKEIRDGKLYREAYKTFEKYVDEKWGMQRAHAYRLIEASDVKQILSPIGDKNKRVLEIKTEGQLRELKDVPAESLESVVDKAAAIAGDDPITASDLKQARVEVLEQAAPKAKASREEEPLEYVDVDDEEFADDDYPGEPQEDNKLAEFKTFWSRCSDVSRAAIRIWIIDNA
jgi:hypothetical protein